MSYKPTISDLPGEITVAAGEGVLGGAELLTKVELIFAAGGVGVRGFGATARVTAMLVTVVTPGSTPKKTENVSLR